jgi:hypothetical protein
MSDSGSIETWAFLDDDDEASAPGGAPLIPIIVTLASPEVPLTTANLTSHAGSVKSGGPDAPEDESITSSAFELLDEEEQDEILAMGRLQRRAEYSAARSEGRSARRAITTGPNAVGMLVSTLSKLQIGMAASCAARNTTHSSTRPTPVVPAAPENDLVFARALAAYLRSKTEGTPEVRGLRGWQILAQAGGVTVISNSIPEIIRVSLPPSLSSNPLGTPCSPLPPRQSKPNSSTSTTSSAR